MSINMMKMSNVEFQGRAPIFRTWNVRAVRDEARIFVLEPERNRMGRLSDYLGRNLIITDKCALHIDRLREALHDQVLFKEAREIFQVRFGEEHDPENYVRAIAGRFGGVREELLGSIFGAEQEAGENTLTLLDGSVFITPFAVTISRILSKDVNKGQQLVEVAGKLSHKACMKHISALASGCAWQAVISAYSDKAFVKGLDMMVNGSNSLMGLVHTAFSEAIALNPQHLHARFRRGLMAKELGAYPLAVADLGFVASKVPQNKCVRDNLVEALAFATPA